MTCFIYKDRYYHLFGTSVIPGKESMLHKVNYIKTKKGLLIETSTANEAFLDGEEVKVDGEFETMASFMVFDGTNEIVNVYNETEGVYRRTRIPYKNISNYNDLIIASSTITNGMFISMMIEAGRSPRDIFEAQAKTMYVASNTEAFMANADGIPLEDIFKHPYAQI